MSDETQGTQDSGPSLRDTIESAVASHTASPDIESAVNGAVEHRDREVREQSRGKAGLDREGQASEARRKAVRDAVSETKTKLAAQGGSKPMKPGEAPVGPPPNWDRDAKASWNDLPQEVRLAELRQHAELKPHFERLAEYDRVMAPVRDTYRQHGLKTDAEAIGRLLEWEATMRDPARNRQAAIDLMRQVGIDPRELAAMAGGAPPQSYGHQPQVAPQAYEAASSQLGKFAQGKEHFEAVRETMGALIQARASRYVTADGSINLTKAYADACRLDGLTDAPRARPAPSSPARGSERWKDPRRSGTSVGDSLRAAFAASRG